jgi:hypothetical protein
MQFPVMKKSPSQEPVLSSMARPQDKSLAPKSPSSPILDLQRMAGNQAVLGVLGIGSSGQPSSVTPGGGSGHERASVQKLDRPGGRAGSSGQRRTGKKEQRAEADEYAIELALWVLDDLLQYETSRLLGDAPGKYRVGLENLYQALAGRHLDRKKIAGRERRELFDVAVLGLRPVLARAKDSQRAFLRRKRVELLREEADDRIESSIIVDNKLVEIPDDRHPREQAALLRTHLPKLIQTLQIANEQLVRLGHHELKEALEELEKGGHGNAFSRLAALQGLLALADGWLTLTDEELQKELTHIHGVLPGVATYTELVKAIVEISGGAVTLTALLGAAVAKAAGESATAAAAMQVAGEVGHLLGNVVAGIEIVHGIFVLLDPKATASQKERAAFGVAAGGAWFLSGGPASFAVVATYLELKLVAYLYWQGALGINTMFMREAFEYMQDHGGTMARAAERLARAGLLLQEERDPLKARALAEVQTQNSQMLATVMDDFLQHSVPGGKDMGFGQSGIASYPGNYSILAEVFAPLQGLRGIKSGPALAAAAKAVLEKITWCLTHAGEIVVASTKRQHLRDVEEAAAKAAQGHQE